MNITLINPLSSEKYITHNLHLSLLYLATALNKEGHKVNVIDAQMDYTEKEIDSLINKTDFFGISVMTTQVKHALEISDYIKSLDNEVPVIWGGTHCTLFPQQTIKDKSVDYVVCGEGENTLNDFINIYNKDKDFSKVNGLIYKEKEEIKMNPKRPYLNLDSLSPPDWDLIKIKRYVVDYIVGDVNYGKYLPLHSGRGCVYRCAFCINTDKKWRPITASNMMNEVMGLKEKFNLNYIKFVDENFFIDKKRVEDFCKYMIEEKIDVRWQALGRVDYFNKNHLNNELLRLIKKSGCELIGMGFESGSQKILKILKKDITISQSLNAVKECGKFDLRAECSFMMGLPTETKVDILQTISLIKKVKEIQSEAYIIGPQIFRPYPGTELYNLAKSMGLEEPNDLREWADYDFAKNLPWVKDFGFIEAVEFYINKFQNPSTNIISRIISFISKHRVNNDFYDLPIDKNIFKGAKRLYNMVEVIK